MAIDKEKFKENFSYFDKEIVLEIINMFIDEYPDRMEKIRKNIEERDFDELKFNAHSIKGVISNFVAEDARLAAKSLEDKGAAKDDSDLETLYEDLKQKAGEVYNDLLELKKEYE
jgi:HPt (histidine-containing phosphotransfer) domain-containing protein